MDIQKAASTSYAYAEIKRQRELAPVREANRAGSRTVPEAESARIETDDRRAVSPDELEAVLNRINRPSEQRKEAGEQRTAQYPTVLNARTKHALNAYLAQSDLPQYEAKSTLSQILGVDDYA